MLLNIYNTTPSFQESAKLVEEILKNFDESIPKEDVKIVILKPEIRGGSVGITLAGGVDYEVKAITVT